MSIVSTLIRIFYQGILVRLLFCAVLCWGGGIVMDDKNRINKLLQKTRSVIGLTLEEKEQGPRALFVMFLIDSIALLVRG